MVNSDYENKIIALKKKVSEETAHEMVEEKKTSLFRVMLKKPKSEDVHIHSIKLYYEAILLINGNYTADYFRKAIHPIKVDYNVSEVVLGEGVFPIRTKSNIEKAFSGTKGKNKVDLELEEHVFIDNEDTIYFDHHGKEIKFPFKTDSKSIENYSKRILQNNEPNVKKPEITYEAAIEKLGTKLKKPMDLDVRELNDKFTINEISEVYVPIFEARLIGPKKKVKILRIDAVRKKIL